MNSKIYAFVLFLFAGNSNGKQFKIVDPCNQIAILKENNAAYGIPGVFHKNGQIPPNWETKSSTHIPFAQIEDANAVVVSLPHGSSVDHSITTFWIEDENGKIISCKELSGNVEFQKEVFVIPATTSHIIPFEHCSLHGVWKGTPVDRFEALILKNKQYGKVGEFTKANHPDGFKFESHFPKVSFGSELITVVVDHASPTDEHGVSLIWVKDQTGAVIESRSFSSEKPQMIFKRPAEATVITAWAYCNLHGVWATTVFLNPSSPMHGEL